MEATTTIKQILAGNRIFVPTYQKAYSWETELEKSNSPKQINVFFSDLEDYNKSSTTSRYYFGRFLFLFEEKDERNFGVTEGKQRLTTIIIFLSTLFNRLKQIRPLNETELVTFEDIIKKRSTYRFETVDCDKQFFKDYIIDQIKKDKKGLKTKSAKRIVTAFDFFSSQLAGKDEKYVLKMLDTVLNASCTTHFVEIKRNYMRTITVEQKERLITLNELMAKEEQKAIEKYEMLEKEAKQLVEQKKITGYELNINMYCFTSDEALKKAKGSKKDSSIIFRLNSVQVGIEGWKKFVLNGDEQDWLQMSALDNYQVCHTFYFLLFDKISKLSKEEILLIDNVKMEVSIAYQWEIELTKTSE